MARLVSCSRCARPFVTEENSCPFCGTGNPGPRPRGTLFAAVAMGLALGGRSPGEIAVSVVAELLGQRHGGDGSTMSVIDDAAQRLAAELGEPTESVK